MLVLPEVGVDLPRRNRSNYKSHLPTTATGTKLKGHGSYSPFYMSCSTVWKQTPSYTHLKRQRESKRQRHKHLRDRGNHEAEDGEEA